MIKVTVDTTQVSGLFKNLGVKLPKVLVTTVNVLADMVKAATINEMITKFKGGTSGWVLNSFKVAKAKQGDPVAGVYYDYVNRNFMRTQVEGGVRRPKGMEGLLSAKGVLPKGLAMLPAKGVPLDGYGNMSRGTISQVLSGLKAYTGTNARNNRQGKTLRSGAAFFAIQSSKGKLPAGVYKRVTDAGDMMKAQRYVIAKNLIGSTMKGKAKTAALASLRSHKAKINASMPRGKQLIMAFDTVKPYLPLIKFYELSNRIVQENMKSVFAKVAAIEMGNRLVRR